MTSKYQDSDLKQAAFVQVRFNLPDVPEFSEALWVRVTEVQPARRKVIGRVYKEGGISDLKIGDKVACDYDDIEDIRRRTSIGVADMLESLDG
jgi:hypothetical protein